MEAEVELQWRPVADAAALLAVAGSRVRFLCLDACASHVALGASTGSVYLFARTRAGAREGPLKFVSIVTPQPLARQLSAGGATPRTAGAASPGGRGGAAPPPSAVVQLRFHPGRTSVALATAAGEIFVGQGRAGSVTLTCKDVHLGSAITALAWTPRGEWLLGGDERGSVSVLRGAPAAGGWAALGGSSDGAPCVVQLGTPVVQIDTDERGELALLSDTLRTTVLTLPGAKLLQLGAKPREGLYGACFHPLAALAMPGGAAASAAPMLASRPGRRLWLAEASPKGEGPPQSQAAGYAAQGFAVVRATLRPALGAASAWPGAAGAEPAGQDAGAADAAGPPFGRLLPAGACAIAVSDRALALVDFLGVAVLAWWPLRDTSTCFATWGSTVFALAGGVHALAAPASGEALVRLAAPADMLRATRLAARFGFVDQELLLEARASFGFAPPDSDAAAVLAEYEAVFSRARAAAAAAARAAEEAAAAAAAAALFESIQQQQQQQQQQQAQQAGGMRTLSGGGRGSMAGSAAPRGGPGSATARSATSLRGGAASSVGGGGDDESDAGSVSGAEDDSNAYLSEASSGSALVGRGRAGAGQSPGAARVASGGISRAFAGSGDESDGGGRGGSAASALKAALLSAIPSVPSFGSLSRQRAPSPGPSRGRAPSPAPLQRMPSPAPDARRGRDGALFATSAPTGGWSLADATRTSSLSSAAAPAPFGIVRMPSNSAAGSRAGSVTGGSRPASRAASPTRAPSLAASSPAASPRHGPRSSGAAVFGRASNELHMPSSPSWNALAALEGYAGSADGSAATAAALAAAREPRGAFVAAAATGAAAAAVYAPKPEAEVLAAAATTEQEADGAEGETQPAEETPTHLQQAFEGDGDPNARDEASAASPLAPLMVPLRRARRRRARRRLGSGASLDDDDDDDDGDGGVGYDNDVARWGEEPLRRRSFSGTARGTAQLRRAASNGSDMTATVSVEGTSGGPSAAAEALVDGAAAAASSALWSPASAPAVPHHRGRIGGGGGGAAAAVVGSASTPSLSSLICNAASRAADAPLLPPPRSARPLFADPPAAPAGDAAAAVQDPAAQLAKASAAASAAAASAPEVIEVREADIEGWARLDGIDWPPGDSSSDDDDDDDDDGGGEENEDAPDWFPFTRWDAYVDAAAGDGDAATALATMAADANVGRRSVRRRRALRRRRWAAAGAAAALRDAVVSLDAAHLVPWLRVWAAVRNAHLDVEAEELVAAAARRRREGAGAAARAARKRAAQPPPARLGSSAATSPDGGGGRDDFDGASSDGGAGAGSDTDADGSAAAGGSSQDEGSGSGSDDERDRSRQPVPVLELRRARRLAATERRLDAALEVLGMADDGSDADAPPPPAPPPAATAGSSDGGEGDDAASGSDAFHETAERFASDAERPSPLRGRRRAEEEESAAVVAARPGGVDLLADELLYAGDDAGEPPILGRPPGYWHRRARLAQLPEEAREEVLAASFAAALADVDATPVPPPSQQALVAAAAAVDAHCAAAEAAARDGLAPPAPPTPPSFGAAVLASPAAATLLRMVDDFAAAAGAPAAISALQRALEAAHAPGGLARRAGSAPRGTRTALDLVALAATDALLAAHAAQLGRDAASVGLLEPLDAYLWAPPRAALGRAPQLRAVLERELRGAPLSDLPFLERKAAPDGGADYVLAFARGGAEPLPPFAEERGHWGVRVRVGHNARCRRCTTPLAGPEPAQLIALPCGHVFHAQCLPEEACVTCMLANCAPLPGQPAHKARRGRAAKPTPWVQYATRER